MAKKASAEFSRRERQIMEIVYQLHRASVAEVAERMADPPSYSAVRALMGVLERKGHLRHVEVGQTYIYSPSRGRGAAAKTAVNNLVRTFFGGSVERAVAAILDSSAGELSENDLARLEKLIQQARQEGR